MNEGDLEKLAVEELLREAKRGRERAKDMGPAGWDKCPVPPANKRFLINTLASQLSDKKRQPERKKSVNDGRSTSSSSTNQKLVAGRSGSTGKSRTHHAADSPSRKRDRHRKSRSRSRSRDKESSKSRSYGHSSRSKSSEQRRKKPYSSRSSHRSTRDRSKSQNKD